MHVAVTGANGRLGRAVVSLLLEQGMEVVGLDKEGTHRQADASFLQVDLCNLSQVLEALAGADAVVHLGAIPSPVGRPPELVYGNNIMSQFNVFEAANRLNIRRVVSASSFSAFGFPFQHRWSEPLYLPIDEAHPLLPQDAYGLSKANGEEIAAAYCRRTGGSAVSLRITHVVNDSDMHSFFEDVRQAPGRYAAEFWAYVHVNDVARACLLGLTRPLDGHQIFLVAADDTSSELPTNELLDHWYPAVPRRPGTRNARWSLLDTTRAREILGFVPSYCWSNNEKRNGSL
ncbi:MAG TPA: NAD(P)-dependent oxidoreductase [Ktedonobacteraceae bacterium]|nr:NAD(P)-dependent oxidoreductase [Ktedonobacteraceae bacterium]